MNEGEDRLRAQIEAYHAAALVFAAVKLGLPERLGERQVSAEAFATELRLSPSHLHRFLRGLVTIGICEEHDGGGFSLTALGKALGKGSPSQLGAKAEIVVEQYWRPWADIAHTLATGEPAFEHVFGTPVWAWRREHAKQGAAFDAYLAEESLAASQEIAAALDFSGVRTVADIGGGRGGLLAGVLKAHPEIEGVLFDLPATAEAALPFLADHGVADRVRFAAGSFFTGIPVKADLYLLKSVLQQWDDAGALTILSACRKAMPPRARLAIVERLMPERALDDPGAVMADLHMMTISGGRGRKLVEIEALLAEAGLFPARMTATASGLSIISATSR